MDPIKTQNVKAVVDELLQADLQSNREESHFPGLEDWEMVMAGGGQTLVCW